MNKWVSRGVAEKVDTTTLAIKELPINTWVDDYKVLSCSSVDKSYMLCTRLYFTVGVCVC